MSLFLSHNTTHWTYSDAHILRMDVFINPLLFSFSFALSPKQQWWELTDTNWCRFHVVVRWAGVQTPSFLGDFTWRRQIVQNQQTWDPLLFVVAINWHTLDGFRPYRHPLWTHGAGYGAINRMGMCGAPPFPICIHMEHNRWYGWFSRPLARDKRYLHFVPG